MAAPYMDEDFLEFESKVNQVVKLLEDMSSANKTDAEEGKKDAKKKDIYDDFDAENFIVTVRDDRTVLNTKAQAKSGESDHMDKFTFMQQMEEDANERAKVRKERERIAQNFRGLGNEMFRKENYEKAINYYTKAIEHIKDSPILYNNRALCYIKMRNNKRAIIDCDFVLNKLDEKNMRSWLYRAAAYKRLNDELNFETSVKFAKKNNSKETEFIDAFVHKIRSGQF